MSTPLRVNEAQVRLCCSDCPARADFYFYECYLECASYKEAESEFEEDEHEYDPDRDPPLPFRTWEEWERTKSSENDRDMREYIRSMV